MRPEINRIIIAVLTTDRYLDAFTRVSTGIGRIKTHCDTAAVLVVCRQKDAATIQAWRQLGVTVVPVEDYEEPNWEKVCEQRNLVQMIAKQSGYDAVWYVDADVVVSDEVVKEVLETIKEADVVCAPYLQPLRSNKGYIVGVQGKDGVDLADARELGQNRNIYGGPIGCTLVRKELLDVPFEMMSWEGNTTEDIGWFANLHKLHPEVVVKATRAYPGHLYDREGGKPVNLPAYDPLANFANWFLEQPLKALRPPKFPIYAFGDVVCIVLHRSGQFQVELVIAMPNHKGFPAHCHPNVDSIQIALAGEPDFTLEGRHISTQEQINGEAVDGSSLLCGTFIRTKEGQEHGADFGKEGGMFLNIEYWKNGIAPSSTGLDWNGEPHQEELKKHLRTTEAHP